MDKMTKDEQYEFAEIVAEKVISKVKGGAFREMAWDIFSTLGLQALEDILVEQKNSGKQIDYYNIARIYEKRLRGMAIRDLEKLLNHLTESPVVDGKF